jgi:hypothetical protein
MQHVGGWKYLYIKICLNNWGRGVFLNNRGMDNLFLNRMNSRQGIVKKKQETIFEISMGSPHYFKMLLKI